MLAVSAAPVPSVREQAPPPRLVKPDMSLIVRDQIAGKDGFFHICVKRVGFRNGKPLPAEVIWEGDERNAEQFMLRVIWANRYLVSYVGGGSVLDLQEKKVINTERDGDVIHIDDKKVTYWIAGKDREQGLFTFEYATGTLTRIEMLKTPRLRRFDPLSPDGRKAIDWVDGELFLHRDGQKPKSLGTGFKMDRKPVMGLNFSMFPHVWLDDERILTQRGIGKLVTVTLDGKVTDVVTIKDLPEDAWVEMWHDGAGSIIFTADQKVFKIDVAKKTAKLTDWHGLGHGFEESWERDKKFRITFRHNGEEIGQFNRRFDYSAAPGYLALPVRDKKIMVWCATTREWTALECDRNLRIIDWVKEEPAKPKEKP
jgi:hypothetical protein